MGCKLHQIHQAIVSVLNFFRKRTNFRNKKQSTEEEELLVYNSENIYIEETNNLTATEDADFELIQL